MTNEQIAKARAEEEQSRLNAADRPRIRALEIARRDAPGYHQPQPGQPPGVWRVDGTIEDPKYFGQASGPYHYNRILLRDACSSFRLALL